MVLQSFLFHPTMLPLCFDSESQEFLTVNIGENWYYFEKKAGMPLSPTGIHHVMVI
jgi:hypothetical protein